MATFAIQYLESPYPDATPNAVRQRLRQACERLPISLVLLGWELSPTIEEAVAEETVRQHAQLFRWQPLLSGDAHTDLPTEWTTHGLEGDLIPGFGGMPEFTFICPNRSAVADFLTERVESVALSGLFQGVFLDRIRFPSPSADPLGTLACFCEDCTRLAADRGLDLEIVRQYLRAIPADAVIRSLLGHPAQANSPLENFLDFREASITRAVRAISELCHSYNLSIGLDCFSPTLTRMVGQELSTLDGNADWVKIMSYPRVFGPAGISFELKALAEWLIQHGLNENEALKLLVDVSGLPVPLKIEELTHSGLGSEALAQEIRHGYEMGITTLLAGLATVQMEGVHHSTPDQIHADVEASRSADGLVISWDLWLTPLQYLDTIRTSWS